VGKVKESAKLNYGYNAQTDGYEDLVAAGVIDPTKVTRTALQNAASIAGLLLTTECVVVEKKEKEKMPPMPGGGWHGRDVLTQHGGVPARDPVPLPRARRLTS